jgi:N-acetylmuramoyl-L-alanine amidase
MDRIDVAIKDGRLLISIPVNAVPQPSASGKTLVVASTRGNLKTAVLVDGKTLTLGLNAYIAK